MGDHSVTLTFHGIGDPPRRLDPEEAHVWLAADEFGAVLDWVAARRDVKLTFDDGNASDLERALPELRRRGLTAAFFVVAGRLGAPGFLDPDGVRALADAGMTIGCHGMRHRAWRHLDEHALHEEIVDARNLLEDVVDRPVAEAACPFGSYDRRVLHALRRCGYRRVYTSDRGSSRPEQWLQARNTVRRGGGTALATGALAPGSRREALRRRARLAAKRWR